MRIFVFGSNLAGRHGKGAALDAKELWGAEYGVGEGPTGRAYAIPTKDEKLKRRSLFQIGASVKKFIEYAKEHPEMTFFVTRIGCGLAGYKDDDIGPMFHGAPSNCELPPGWGIPKKGEYY
jgi:hypothetical protein